MPTVPRYVGPQVEETPLRGGNLQAPDQSQNGLGALARGLGDMADTATRLGNDQASQAAFAAETGIKSRWAAKQQELQKQFQGANAAGYGAAANEFWDGERTGVATLSPLAQKLIGPSLGTARLQAQTHGEQYMAGEIDRAQVQAFNASQTVEIQRAITDGRPEVVATSAELIRRRNAEQSVLKGWAPETLAAANTADLNALHTQFIATLATKDPIAAKLYFEAHRAEIASQNQGRIEGVITASVQDQTARQTAASLAGKPLADQLVEVAKITDPVLRDKTMIEVKQAFGLVKQAQQEREASASDAAWQAIGKGKRPDAVTLDQMDGKERVRLNDYLRDRAEHAASKGASAAVRTDPALHAQLWEQMTRDPEAFKNTRLSSYGMKLSGADLEQLFSQQQKLLNPKTERDVQSFQQRLTARLEQQGIASGNGENERKRGAFRGAAQSAVDEFTARTGKNPGPKDETEILDRLAIEQSNFFGANTRYYEVAGTDKAKGFVPKVSDADRTTIAAELKKRGQPNDDRAVIAAYKKWKGL